MAGRHASNAGASTPADPPGGPGHGHGPAPRLDLARAPRRALGAFLLAALAAALLGVVVLAPAPEDVPHVDYAAPGVSFPDATVLSVRKDCTPTEGEGSSVCAQVRVEVTSGADAGRRVEVAVPPEVVASGLSAGDTLQLVRLPAREGAPTSFTYAGVERSTPLVLMALLFVVVVAAVARLRGLLAVLGLVVAGVVLLRFVLPALLAGSSGLAVALVGATVIMFPVLYLAHGFSWRTSTALAGTLVGVGAVAAISEVAVAAARLSGVSDDATGLLTAQAPGLDFQGLLTCGIILAALGVLNDVTITQASAVWELRSAAPGMSRSQLYRSGMRIGRDHIASTIYTIAFAYAGAALGVLLLLGLYDRPLLELLGTEGIGEEVVRTLAGAIGLVLSVPLTTGIAVLVTGAATPGGEDPAPAPGAPPGRGRRLLR